MTKNQLFNKPVHKQTLAEKLSTEIERMILANELNSGVNLPSEIDLASQYGVSRSVARDATRILMAKGLVEVQHGRGVFVSDPGNDTFIDALLITLKRNRVTAWEIRQIEQQLLPQITTLAIKNGTETELVKIQETGLAYLDTYLSFHARWEEEILIPELEQTEIKTLLIKHYRIFLGALAKACHNKALALLFKSILMIHTSSVEGDSQNYTPPPYFGADVHNFRQFLKALEHRDLSQAPKVLKGLMSTSEENIEKMKELPLEKFPFLNQIL